MFGMRHFSGRFHPIICPYGLADRPLEGRVLVLACGYLVFDLISHCTLDIHTLQWFHWMLQVHF